MAETSSNAYLSEYGEAMTGNAEIIWSNRNLLGWTKNATCGMLGNMQVESTINPGIWQSLNWGNMSGGFGLVQWTPATNYINWAGSQGWTTWEVYGRIVPQMARIDYEIANGLQWIPTSEYPLSFREFSQSDQSPEYLASAFLKNYERAGVEAENIRRQHARHWFDTLEGGGVIPRDGSERTPIWLYLFP